jgi:hypothetical protein
METVGLDPQAVNVSRARRVRKIAVWVILGSIALIVFVSLLPSTPSKPAPTTGFARMLDREGAPGVTAAFAFAMPSGAEVPISEISQPGNHASMRVYVWASGPDPVRTAARDIHGVLRWEVGNPGAMPLATDFEIGYGRGHLFGRKGDKTYLTIAYTRKAVETNKSIWSGKRSTSKRFAAAVLNSASAVAMLQGRLETRWFCSHVPEASRFCALIEKSISFQDSLGSK